MLVTEAKRAWLAAQDRSSSTVRWSSGSKWNERLDVRGSTGAPFTPSNVTTEKPKVLTSVMDLLKTWACVDRCRIIYYISHEERLFINTLILLFINRGDFAIFNSHLKIYKSVGQNIDTKHTKCTLQSCTLTLCMRTMSPFRKILGWSSSFSQKMVQPIFSLEWSVIFRLEQKSVKRELYDIRKKCLVYHKNNSTVSETRTVSTNTCLLHLSLLNLPPQCVKC